MQTGHSVHKMLSVAEEQCQHREKEINWIQRVDDVKVGKTSVTLL